MHPKYYLNKGKNTLAIVLLLMFTTPIVLNIGYKALEKKEIYWVLVVGIGLLILTIILFALGINYLLKHLFKK